MSRAYAVGIGAANIDIYGRSLLPIREKTDHPAEIFTGAGGVTRNILDNLQRLDVPVSLISAVGDDMFGKMLLQMCRDQGLDVSQVLTVPGENTGVFLQVLSEDQDMHLALCDMRVMRHIDTACLQARKQLLDKAALIIMDPSLPDESLEYLVSGYGNKIVVDPVSDLYAEKMIPYAGRIYAMKPNRTELEVLSGMKITDEITLEQAGQKLIEKGLKTLYISLGRDGCLYLDQDRVIRRKMKPVETMVNASGAGDSFLAGVLSGILHGCEPEEALDYGLAAGRLAVQCQEAINPDLNLENLKKIIKENRQ